MELSGSIICEIDKAIWKAESGAFSSHLLPLLAEELFVR
jgi:hypothetical protein